MNLFATALITGILFLPSVAATTPAADNPAPKAIASDAGEEPSPTKVAIRTESATTPLSVTLTAYNAVPSQTDSDPTTTASGLASNSEVIAARSQDLGDELPFGTVIRISRVGTDTPGCRFHAVAPQIGYRVIGDTMNARWEQRVDVELDAQNTVTVGGKQVNPGLALGVCSKVTVEIVGHLPLSRVPETQAELARLFATREVAINR